MPWFSPLSYLFDLIRQILVLNLLINLLLIIIHPFLRISFTWRMIAFINVLTILLIILLNCLLYIQLNLLVLCLFIILTSCENHVHLSKLCLMLTISFILRVYRFLKTSFIHSIVRLTCYNGGYLMRIVCEMRCGSNL